MGEFAALLAAVAVLVWPGSRRARAVRALLTVRVPDERDGLLRPRSRTGRSRGFPSWPGIPRRRRGPDGDWLPVLDELAASLRAGLTPVDALTLAADGSQGPVRATLQAVASAAREGRACVPAWQRAARGRASRGIEVTELEIVSRAWAISERLGAPLADGIGSAARAVRARRQLSGALETSTAGARATATILTLLPVAGVGIAATMGIPPGDLYGTPAALTSLALGVVLLAVGRAVVRGMVDRVARPS